MWGLDKQEECSILKILFSLFKAGVVILVLEYSPSIISFLVFQLSVTFVFIIYIRSRLVKAILTKEKRFSFFSTFNMTTLDGNRRFASGMFFISVVSALNYQTDKIILSNLLPIEILGFYNLAFLLSQTTVSASSPVGSSLFPKLTALSVSKDIKDLSTVCREGFLMILMFSLSIGLTILFASDNIIYLWTGDTAAAASTKGLLSFLVIGSILQSWQIIPFNLAVASKKPKIIVVMASINLIFTIPIYYYLIGKLGVIGAGYTWMIFNGISTPLFIILIFRKYIDSKFSLKIFADILKVFCVNFIVVYSLFYLIFTFLKQEEHLLIYGIIISLSFLVSALIFIRPRLKSLFLSLKLLFN